jgi:hypothetical protein
MLTEGGDLIASLITLSKSVESRQRRPLEHQNSIKKIKLGKRQRDDVDSFESTGESSFTIKEGNVSAANDYPFQADADDHCETPLEAYRDISAFLESIGKSLNKSKESILVYDPYFCEGEEMTNV